jgi:hypothetical protein
MESVEVSYKHKLLANAISLNMPKSGGYFFFCGWILVRLWVVYSGQK